MVDKKRMISRELEFGVSRKTAKRKDCMKINLQNFLQTRKWSSIRSMTALVRFTNIVAINFPNDRNSEEPNSEHNSSRRSPEALNYHILAVVACPLKEDRN